MRKNSDWLNKHIFGSFRTINSDCFTSGHYKWSHWLSLQYFLYSLMTNLSQSRKSLSRHWFTNGHVFQSLPRILKEKSAGGLLKKVPSILRRNIRKTPPLNFLWILSFLNWTPEIPEYKLPSGCHQCKDEICIQMDGIWVHEDTEELLYQPKKWLFFQASCNMT